VAGLLSRGPLLTPNATELHDLAVLVGSDRLEGAEAARAIAARTGTPIVVTLGADGAMAVTPAGEVDVAPPRRTAVRDTTGAGDTYNGVLAVRLAAGDALGTAMRAATVAASLSVAHAGARRGMPNAAAIDAALRAA
jgi:ribokinase